MGGRQLCREGRCTTEGCNLQQKKKMLRQKMWALTQNWRSVCMVFLAEMLSAERRCAGWPERQRSGQPRLKEYYIALLLACC